MVPPYFFVRLDRRDAATLANCLSRSGSPSRRDNTTPSSAWSSVSFLPGILASRASLIYFDVKLIDPEQHRRHTGASNDRIHSNLRVLSGLGVPFVIRVPLIPGVTDTEANLSAIARLVAGMRGLQRVDLLPYNRAAGAKYGACGLKFQPRYDESRPVNPDTACVAAAGIEVRVL